MIGVLSCPFAAAYCQTTPDPKAVENAIFPTVSFFLLPPHRHILYVFKMKINEAHGASF
jgi:hypothetical protein